MTYYEQSENLSKQLLTFGHTHLSEDMKLFQIGNITAFPYSFTSDLEKVKNLDRDKWQFVAYICQVDPIDKKKDLSFAFEVNEDDLEGSLKTAISCFPEQAREINFIMCDLGLPTNFVPKVQ